MSTDSPTVLITGAAGAIGSVVAEAFAREGYALALIDYGSDNAETLRRRHPNAHVTSCDLTDDEATRQAIEEVGPVEAVLCIAGGFAMQPVTEASPEDYEHLVGLNVETLFNTTRAVVPHMQEQERGFILGMSAAAALEGGSQMALYAASKAAVAAYLKSLNAELAGDGIRVSVLYPMNAVDTPANREAMPNTDPSGWIDPQEIAESILHLVRRTRRGHIPELKLYASTSDGG